MTWSFQGRTFTMFTARTCLVMVSPNMHILSPVVSFLLHPRTHRLSHNLVISFASCSDNRVSCINYWLSSTPEQERESRYLPVPPACRYRPLRGTASSTPGTNVHDSQKTGLLSAWPSMAQTTFQKTNKGAIPRGWKDGLVAKSTPDLAAHMAPHNSL